MSLQYLALPHSLLFPSLFPFTLADGRSLLVPRLRFQRDRGGDALHSHEGEAQQGEAAAAAPGLQVWNSTVA